MAFRDETEALRARVRSLEVELAEAMDQLGRFEHLTKERDRLAARVRELEGKEAAPAPRAQAPSPAPASASVAAAQALKRRLVVFAAGGAMVLGIAFYALSSTSYDELEANAAPTHGMVDLDQHPAPPPLAASATGDLYGNDLAPGCMGYVPSAPVVVLRTGEPRLVRVWTESSADLVLLVRAADGQVTCDDDGGDAMNPRLELALPAGDYRVWVGTYGAGDSSPYTLRIDATAPAAEERAAAPSDGSATLDLEAAPTGGVLVLGDELDVREVSGAAEAPTVAATELSSVCRGHLPTAPLVQIDVDAPRLVNLTTRSDADLVMLLRLPDGQLVCDDDGGASLNPLIAHHLPAGRSSVWVGTYGASGDARPFQLEVRPSVSEPSLTPAQLIAEALPPDLGEVALAGDEAVGALGGLATGDVPARTIEPTCAGFVTRAPRLAVSTEREREMTLVASDARLELLVVHADGTSKCHSAASPLVGRWPAGRHLVWVGVPDAGDQIPFSLTIVER